MVPTIRLDHHWSKHGSRQEIDDDIKHKLFPVTLHIQSYPLNCLFLFSGLGVHVLLLFLSFIGVVGINVVRFPAFFSMFLPFFLSDRMSLYPTNKEVIIEAHQAHGPYFLHRLTQLFFFFESLLYGLGPTGLLSTCLFLTQEHQ